MNYTNFTPVETGPDIAHRYSTVIIGEAVVSTLPLLAETATAIEKIKGYLNVTGNPKWTKEYVLSNYGIAVQLLVEKAESYKVMPGVKSFSEGGQSMTFSDEGKWTITDDIKDLLPAPFVKLMG